MKKIIYAVILLLVVVLTYTVVAAAVSGDPFGGIFGGRGQDDQGEDEQGSGGRTRNNRDSDGQGEDQGNDHGMNDQGEDDNGQGEDDNDQGEDDNGQGENDEGPDDQDQDDRSDNGQDSDNADFDGENQDSQNQDDQNDQNPEIPPENQQNDGDKPQESDDGNKFDTSLYSYRAGLSLPTVAQYGGENAFENLFYDIALARAGVPAPPEIADVRFAKMDFIYFPDKLMTEMALSGLQLSENQLGIFFIDVFYPYPETGYWREFGYLCRYGADAQSFWQSALNSSSSSVFYNENGMYVIKWEGDWSQPDQICSYLWWQDGVLMWFYYRNNCHERAKDDVLSYLSVTKRKIDDFLPDLGITYNN